MKELQLTETMKQAITKIAGGDVNFDNLAVFEVTAINTLPLNKRGTLYEGARFTRATLTEISKFINTNGLHLQTLHQQGSELPIGRVFMSDVVDNQLDTEVRALFYLPRDTQSKLIADINSGTIDEVSIGALPKHLLCSECGFDFLGAEASFMNRYEMTCDNGHTIGVNGVYANISGLDDLFELSLVSRGAATKAKILSRAKSLLASESTQRLAADGRPVEAAILYTIKTEGTRTMKMSAADLAKKVREQVLANFTATATDASILAAGLSATEGLELEAGVDAKAVVTDVLGALKAEFKGLKKEEPKAVINAASDAVLLGQLIDLKADNKLLAASISEKDARIGQLEAAMTAATGVALSFLQEQAVKGQVACGIKEPATPETIDACIETIKKCSVNLSNLLTPGGVARGAEVQAAATVDDAALSAFRVNNS